MTETTDPDRRLPDPLVDDRQVVYDTTATAKPFLTLRAAITEFLAAITETLGRDPDTVTEPLSGNDAWWMRVGTQEYLAAVHLAAGTDGIVRLDVSYDFDATESASIPGPDALPAVDADDDLTVTLVFDKSRPVTPDVAAPEASADGVSVAVAHEQRVDPDDQRRAKTTPVGKRGDGQRDDGGQGVGDDSGGRNGDDPGVNGDRGIGHDDPGADGEVTVTVVGPEGVDLQVNLGANARIGKAVATVIREADGATTVELTRDERGREPVDSDAPAAEFDGQRLHWRPVERPGGDGR
jgi:hypothetical protein